MVTMVTVFLGYPTPIIELCQYNRHHRHHRHHRHRRSSKDEPCFFDEFYSEYLSLIHICNFAIPENLADPQHKDNLILVQNNNDEELAASMKKCVAILEDAEN